MAAVMVEKRSLGALGRMGVVAGMHVAVVLLVANSLGLVPSLTESKPMVTRFYEDPLPIDDPPPATVGVVELADTRVVLPAPDQAPVDADDSGAIGAELVPPDGLRIVEPPQAPRAALIAVRQDPAHPLTQPDYPAAMIRGNNEGVVELEVFVQPNGRVSDARILKSSGFDAFDRATLDEAKRRWRLLPATRDGVPYPQWARQRVVFKLVNR